MGLASIGDPHAKVPNTKVSYIDVFRDAVMSKRVILNLY